MSTFKQIEFMDDLSLAKKWRNLYFKKDGRTYWGDKVWDSEAEAVVEGNISISANASHTRITNPGANCLAKDRTHFIPIPIT